MKLTTYNKLQGTYPGRLRLSGVRKTLHNSVQLFTLFLIPFFTFFPMRVTVAGEDTDLSLALTRELECFPLDFLPLEMQSPSINTRELCLATIYHKRDMQPLWVTESGPGERADIILWYLENSDREGLVPEQYQVPEILSLWNAKTPAHLAKLDTLLTFNLLQYVHDVHYGKIDPLEAAPTLFPEAGEKLFAPIAIIDELTQVPDLRDHLSQMPPGHRYYQALRWALSKYRAFAAKGGWPSIMPGKTIKPGDSDNRLPAIRERLMVTQPLNLSDSDSHHYGPEMVKSIRLFQEHHGLKVDGIIGTETRKELALSPEHLMKRIIINMARWRWQSHKLGRKYVLVNIASFTLQGVQGDTITLESPIIVGKYQHQTPVFSDSIKYIDFHPFWNIPPRIAADEQLLELRKNPLYLVEKDIRLFSDWSGEGVELDSTRLNWEDISKTQMHRYKLRQDPGPFNALGKVKFVFPNRYSVYIHDTPAQDLFNESARFFSHGCIRVGKPAELAVFALNDEKASWSRARVDSILQTVKRKVVRLEQPLPVHITYQTAWVDKEGVIRFNKDIYLRDTKLFEALWRKDK